MYFRYFYISVCFVLFIIIIITPCEALYGDLGNKRKRRTRAHTMFFEKSLSIAEKSKSYTVARISYLPCHGDVKSLQELYEGRLVHAVHVRHVAY